MKSALWDRCLRSSFDGFRTSSEILWLVKFCAKRGLAAGLNPECRVLFPFGGFEFWMSVGWFVHRGKRKSKCGHAGWAGREQQNDLDGMSELPEYQTRHDSPQIGTGISTWWPFQSLGLKDCKRLYCEGGSGNSGYCSANEALLMAMGVRQL